MGILATAGLFPLKMYTQYVIANIEANNPIIEPYKLEKLFNLR